MSPVNVTWKYMTGALIGLVMLMGGYIFKGVDKSGEINAQNLTVQLTRINSLEISMAELKASVLVELQYNSRQNAEILRRLERIENANIGRRAP